MEPEGNLSRSISDINEVMLPQLPPMSDALPIAADSTLDRPSMPKPRGRERHSRTQSGLLIDLLSRRMSRQTLLQQSQSRTAQPPLIPQSSASSLDSHLNDMSMEIDLDETLGDSLPLPTLPCTHKMRPSRRHLPLPYITPIAPETTIDPDVASRVLARMQSDLHPVASRPASPSSAPIIEIDPAEQADVDIEADEGYSEGPEEYPWLGDKPSAGLTGALRSQGLLSFTTSAEAALRCPKLVRNVPRMRKRTHKKKEHRLRTSRDTAGETTQPKAPAEGVVDNGATRTLLQ